MTLKPGWLERQFEAVRRDMVKRRFIKGKCWGVFYSDISSEPTAMFHTESGARYWAKHIYNNAAEVWEL